MKTIQRKIGSNKGKARIWLEGAALQDSGWTNGERFNIEFREGSIAYVRDLYGKRKVAGTPTRPIIDTNTDKILASLRLAVGELVRVSIDDSSITLSKP